MGPAERFVTVELNRLTEAQKTALSTLITTTANFSANTIAVVDDYGAASTVRYWDDLVEFEPRIAGAVRLWSCRLVFRIEA
jgi:hypothetical protein